MKLKTISELNEKAWYRLLKVLYTVGFIILGLITLGITYIIVDEEYRFISCGTGNYGTFHVSESGYNYLSSSLQYWDDSEHNAVRSLCDITEAEVQENLQMIFDGISREPLYDIVNASDTSRGWFYIILYWILFGCLTTLLFLLGQHIFYYVVIGKFNPQK